MTADSTITSTFPIAALTPIATPTSPPTFQSLRNAQRELNACASSVHSDGGGGRHGHLSLTIDAATFLALTGVAFIVPVAPPLAPVLPPAATGPIITEANRQHAEDKRLFHRYHDTDKALIKMLIAAVPPIYLDPLNDPDYGFAHVTTLEMLTHLKTTYGRISIAERDANHLRMTAPWHPPQAIEDLFQQLQDGVRFAMSSGEPIADSIVARLGYNNILQTGLFTDACREWRLTPEAQQTYAAFKTHFRRMDFDRQEAQTTGSAGYHNAIPTAHSAEELPPSHAANAATTNPTADMLSTLITEIRLLRQATTKPGAPRSAPAAGTTATSYCWTHGSSRNLEHTSLTCRAKADGHVDSATVTHKHGGSDKVWSGSSRSRTA